MFGEGGLEVDAGSNPLHFLLTLIGDRLLIGESRATAVGERSAEDRWIAAFLTRNPVWAAADDRLVLTAGDTQIGFTAIPPWGRTYAAVAVRETGPVPAPVVAGTTITLTFTAPDRLTAQAGCNGLRFRVTLADRRLGVDDQVVSTRITCPEALEAQDRWLTAFLLDDPEFLLDADTLTLTRASTTIMLEVAP
jgi:heat shock protein HslJ